MLTVDKGRWSSIRAEDALFDFILWVYDKSKYSLNVQVFYSMAWNKNNSETTGGFYSF